MEHDDLLPLVLQAADASEGYELRHFEVWRQNRNLKVTLLDAGAQAGAGRYMVAVHDVEEIDPDAAHSLGNPEATVKDALAGVHWSEFTGAR